MNYAAALSGDLLYNFLVAFVDTIFSAFVFIVSLIALSRSIFVRIAEPSFDLLRKRRWLELLLGYGVLSILLIFFGSFLSNILTIPQLDQMGQYKYFIPATIYIYFRSIARFVSSRASKDLLMSFCFVFLLVVSLQMGFAFYNGQSSLSVFFSNLLNLEDFAGYFAVGLISVFLGDVILYYLPLQFSEGYKAKTRLIDLTDKLPVEMEKVIWEKNINNRILSMLTEATKEIVILSRHLRTLQIKGLFELLDEKKKIGVTIKLIACEKKLCELRQQDSSTYASIVDKIDSLGLHRCSGKFDDVRVIIVDRQKVLTSFATAAYDNSHIGIYIDHPFAVALFNNYIDTKCNANQDCSNKCKPITNNPDTSSRTNPSGRPVSPVPAA